MKLPRDVSARQLIKALARLGYTVIRQPAALGEIAAHRRIDKSDLMRRSVG